MAAHPCEPECTVQTTVARPAHRRDVRHRRAARELKSLFCVREVNDNGES